jgi:hypothetical protein
VQNTPRPTPLSFSLPTNACRVYAMMSDAERARLQIPLPGWMARDPLRKSVELYPRLWDGGRVVWACVVQANSELFSPDGSPDLPGDIVFDPSGKLGYAELSGPSDRIIALKHTQPADAALRAIADHLTNEMTRVCGMRVPRSISPHPLLVSTVLFHRDHLPDRKLSRSVFPVLINDALPGVAMVLPSQLWPHEFVDAWCGNPPGTRAREALDVEGGARRYCGTCKRPMRKLGLAAHYQHQKQVEIDVCESCSLIWFDDTESARLGGPGLADLVRVIHEAMRRPRSEEPLPLTLPCPICAEPLKRVSNVSRFGRTAQLECPQGHGAYQSFALFLAEKGYFRPFTWADIKEMQASGKRMQCFNCGAGLEPRPHDECPYCRSPVGLLDPARLADAINTAGAGAKLSLIPSVKQTSCPCCGGPLDLTTEMVCTHCKAVVRPVKTEQALEASEAVESQVRRNHESQLSSVSRHKLETLAKLERPPYELPRSEGTRRLAIIVVGAITLGIFFFGMTRHKAHQMEVAENRDLDARRDLSPTMKEGIVNARAEAAMKKIPHAPTGEPPPDFTLSARGPRVTMVSQTDRHLRVAVNLYNQYLDARCKMVNVDGGDAPNAVFTHGGETHDFIARNCGAKVVDKGKYEFVVYDLKKDQYVFKSESAFYMR